jgi:TetR/AcrR family transcriptional regulator
MNPNGDAISEIKAYVNRKLEMAREFPRESRLFANEILQGAPRNSGDMENGLKPLVDEKAKVIPEWSAAGKIGDVDPFHLIFSIWAMTQHYADFDVQVRTVLANDDPFPGAEAYLNQLFTKLLTP